MSLRRSGNVLKKRIKGVALPAILLLLLIAIVTTNAFMSRSGDELRIGSSLRDSDVSLSIADAAMNRLYGMFASAQLSIADVDNNGVLDRSEGWSDISTASPTSLPLFYTYYISGSTTAQLLQRVANGEGSGTSCSIGTSQKISCAKLMTQDLFAASNIRPILFVNNASGLSESLAADWNSELSRDKAAAWIEMVKNPKNSAWVDLYVEAVGASGRSRSFVQRYIGSYADQMGVVISPLTESGG